MSRDVVVLDYGSGNIRSAVRALEHVGASVTLTGDPEAALAADGLFVPGVGNFHACMAGLAAARGPLIIGRRVAGGRPVLGVCVGMQVLFDGSAEPSGAPVPGVGEWPGTVTRLHAPVVPHMGWSEVEVPAGSELFAGVESERFYFVHSYAVHDWEMPPPVGAFEAVAPKVTWATHGERFVAAVENGPLTATQFHPEKSGEAGLTLLANWVRSL
ncbi:imidazole glycerol phosphate synthase subunit HisH [Arthrobacter sp. NEB 688]|uniref:imidazole glycerol phosphate synthase subunit HisH n=1 Tax=Arthrobacter sp. NEB 688 TaxID=904039 RepID=UPI0015646B74|nr:imidazole glycerol phosphate synthase subunit HisH [Arthrobacter sp. NEB 688]QKE85004.1 imidazole glycerol phosphate synthase subunit HisH [Arthrobacter sp. NEB 688]